MRLSLLLTIILLAFAAAASAAVKAEITATDDRRARLSYQEATLLANRITLSSAGSGIIAEGSAEVQKGDLALRAERIACSANLGTGECTQAAGDLAPFRYLRPRTGWDGDPESVVVHFGAETLRFRPGEKTMDHATFTTCYCARPHFVVTARRAAIRGSDDLVAYGVVARLGRFPVYFTPVLKSDVPEALSSAVDPAFTVGTSSAEGTYLQPAIALPLSSRTRLHIVARVATSKVVRGEARLERDVRLGGSLGTTLSAVAAQADTVGGSMKPLVDGVALDLDGIVVSRSPAFSAELDTQRLGTVTLRAGASTGRYHEEPSGTRDTREQAWMTVHTDTRKLKNGLKARLEAGYAAARYGSGSSRSVAVAQASLESPVYARDHYFNVTYRRAHTSGVSPFAFDVAPARSTIYGEYETPISADGVWRVDLWGWRDMDAHRWPVAGVTLMHRLDCITYGAAYNWATRGIEVGVRLNGLGSFRRGTRSLAFVP